MFAALFINIAPDHCALKFRPGVPFTVVVPGLTAAIFTAALPLLTTMICVPIGKLTEASVGICNVPPFAISITLPSSVKTSGYVAFFDSGTVWYTAFPVIDADPADTDPVTDKDPSVPTDVRDEFTIADGKVVPVKFATGNDPAVTVPTSVISERFPVVITVPVIFGRVIVLSAVGSVTVKIVSKSSSVLPSNTTPKDVILGDANVLLLSVTEFVSVTGKEAHSNPVAVDELAVRTVPSEPTPILTTPGDDVRVTKSPFVVQTVA